jgi:homoserine kinase
MPETADLVARLRARGVPAVVSGAGPTVLAFAPDLSEPGWCARSLSVSRRGARIL